MKRAFKRELNGYDYNEIKIIDDETNEFTQYMQHKEVGFTFSEWNTNAIDMGYKSAKDCIKSLKERKQLGNEVDYTEQKESERIGLLQLGSYRIKHNLQIEDIIERLHGFGMGYCDAQNQIYAVYENSQEVAVC